MAISEGCKFEVKSHVDKLVREQGVSRLQAIKTLADESDQPVETLRKQDLRARSELGQIVPKKDWPTCKNGTKGKCKLWGGNLPVAKNPAGKPAKHSLCPHCRKEELKEQKLNKHRQELEAATEKFEANPVDAESDKFWNELSNQMLPNFESMNGIPCGKVSEEVLHKIDSWSKNLNYHLSCVLGTSTAPTMPST